MISLRAVLLGIATSLCCAVVAQAQGYKIRTGDLLRVEVLEDQTINREVLVAPDGRVSLPLAGNVRVSGVSIPEAQNRVTSALSNSFASTPTIVVSLVKLRADAPVVVTEQTLKVYVMGEVNKPGMLDAGSGTTMLQALSLAGGMTDFAAVKRIQLRRVDKGRERVMTLNYKRVLDGEMGVGMAPVRDGDVILVPARRLFE